MRWILELLVRYRSVAAVCIASGLSFWMISSPPNRQAGTARFLAFSVFYPLQVTFDQATKAKNIYAENQRLKSQVALLYAHVAQLRDEKTENARLRRMLGFEERTPHDIIPVRVVARDPSPVVKSVVVNAGKNKGVLPFMPVVGENGIAGKVVQVMPSLSQVQLIKDPLNRTSIIAMRSRAVSILETGNGNDFFAWFRIHEDIVAGDTVVTSGFGGIYPKGFPAGVVERVVDKGDRLFKKAAIRPCIDVDHSEELFIVRQPPQWAAFRAQLDSLERKR
ncbi:MAG: rod shape-determining protein MreC [Chitinispirillaceae bacterium]|nr:rod shape-determining protein MreC [Chitinispirillaceae bacterium]